MTQNQDQDKTNSLSTNRPHQWLAAGMLVTGLLLTALTTLAMKVLVEAEAQRDLTMVGHEIAAKIQARLHAHAQLLRSGSAYFELSHPVTREQWQAFIEHNQISLNLPGIQGVGFAQLIPSDQLTPHIATIRAQGFPNYRVWPEGERPVYSAIIYLEPFASRNLRAFGYDMLSEPVRRAAMEQARDQDVAALSGKVHLVQETDQDIQAGSLMYVAAYRTDQPTDTLDQRRASLIGWVYSPFRMNDLMHGILGAWEQNGHDHLRLAVYDGDQTTPETLLYDSQPAAPPQTAMGLPGLFQMPIDFNGHRWTLRLAQPGALRSVLADFRIWLVAGSGTIISGLIGFLVLALLRSHAQAGQLVTELSARRQVETALRVAERKYRDIFQTSLVGIYQTTPAGRYLEVNPAFAHILSFATPEQLMAEITDIGAQLYVNPQDRATLARQVAEQGKVQGFEIQARRRDGQTCWVSFDVAGIRDGDGAIGLYQGTMTDISARKRMEAQLRESEALFRLTFDQSPIGAAIVALDYRFLQVNAALCQITGYSSAELIATGLPQITHPDDLGADVGQARRLVANEIDRYAMDKRYIAKSGGLVWIHLAVRLIRDEAGQPSYFLSTMQNITDRKQAEEKLQIALHRLDTLIANLYSGILLVSIDGRIEFANQAFCDLFDLVEMPECLRGLTAGEMLQKIQRVYANPAQALARIQNIVAHGQPVKGEEVEIQGQRLYIRDFIPIIMGGQCYGRLWHHVDITERKRADEKLHLAASVFTHTREGILITDADGTIIDVNDTFTRITGYLRDEVLGRNPRLLSSGLHNPEFFGALWRDLVEKGHWYGEIWNRRKDGGVYAEMLTISAVRDDQGQIEKYMGLFSDITAIKEHERQLEHIAHYDVLTALPNRVLLSDRLQQAMAQAQRREQRIAVAFIDLDGFKAVNDRHGHKAGDQLLITVAARMKQSLREGDTLARLGGDEFVAVLLDLADIEASAPMLTRLLVAAAEPVFVDNVSLQVSASIGVTFYPQADEVDADQLLRQADQAMYQAKLAGKNSYYAFDAEQDRSIRNRYATLDRIRRALTEGEFVLYYQPKVNMRTGTVIGAEALIRWQHAEEGLLPPAQFMPIVDTSGLASSVGHWVISEALRQMSVWTAQGLQLPISVNISARHLQQPDFVAELRTLLAMHPDVSPKELELEILETVALTDIMAISRLIESCGQLGVHFALDDFGTGYSSLTYLKHLAVQVLKIDQSFVRDLLVDTEALAIVQGAIGLSGAFRRGVIAEGVETEAHGNRLIELGCDCAQGYGIARPMPPEQIPAWIAGWTAPWTRTAP